MKGFHIIKAMLPCLYLFLSACDKKPTAQKVSTQPKYQIDLHVWHRRNSFTAETWSNLKNGTQVHYMRHKLVPMFRMFTIAFQPHDTIYEYQVGRATLKTYCADVLVETNTVRRFGGPDFSIYSGQNGLLDCTDREKLYFNIYHRLKADTTQTGVDSLAYEIIMDQDEHY